LFYLKVLLFYLSLNSLGFVSSVMSGTLLPTFAASSSSSTSSVDVSGRGDGSGSKSATAGTSSAVVEALKGYIEK
jgi:hypothetical protein